MKFILVAGIVAFLFLLSCTPDSPPTREERIEDTTEDQIADQIAPPRLDDTPPEEAETTLPAEATPCTSSYECPEDYSCYAELPLGPSAGIKGSPENPGKCYSNEMIGQIY